MRCQWVDNEGVRHDRSFIVGINGHEHAKERAIECRKKKRMWLSLLHLLIY